MNVCVDFNDRLNPHFGGGRTTLGGFLIGSWEVVAVTVFDWQDPEFERIRVENATLRKVMGSDASGN